MAWVAGYFSWGITLFNERIAASPAMQARLSLGSLERDLPQDSGCSWPSMRCPMAAWRSARASHRASACATSGDARTHRSQRRHECG
jgi:hypothetical protein